ncbi:hypothetical protein EYF80_068150 [Liparis tanakae]|uniref:Uncharacterized protein n=1 Tax=Liparis tanakae TaxID=230148 RepID=A0A4Z2DZ55_9TELE|nr:hypothetical protein EYF80_068150 [Liparis tanakae]
METNHTTKCFLTLVKVHEDVQRTAASPSSTFLEGSGSAAQRISDVSIGVWNRNHMSLSHRIREPRPSSYILDTMGNKSSGIALSALRQQR